MTNLNPQMLERMRTGQGFIAALDQSGGSTPKALKLYGIEENEYSGDAAMFDLMHAMRTRMIKSSVFNSNRILAVILFEMTMLRQIDGMGSAEFLWQKKGIVPFLKTDNGLAAEADGVQLMKPVPELADRVALGVSHSVFGTKMRSVIKAANAKGIEANVAQQFEMGKVVLKGGMVPIIEPEVDIKSANKAECEVLLKKNILAQLDVLSADQKVMLKLTIPTVANFYEDLIKHPKVIRVVALSGGYARDEANALLAKNRGMIASFSRALAEGLSAKQSDTEFDAVFDKSIGSIFDASTKKAS
jgi:fructose-bisphosphate aldolase class I